LRERDRSAACQGAEADAAGADPAIERLKEPHACLKAAMRADEPTAYFSGGVKPGGGSEPEGGTQDETP
jgi:hypothetical protein